MESIWKAMRAHKAVSLGLVFGFIILINCCGFPVYNLNKEWQLSLVLEKIYVAAASAVFTGGGLAGLFPRKRGFFIVSLTAVLICTGLACRFLLEFGEVSNTYNFTVPNMAFHLSTMVALSSLSWLYAAKCRQAET